MNPIKTFTIREFDRIVRGQEEDLLQDESSSGKRLTLSKDNYDDLQNTLLDFAKDGDINIGDFLEVGNGFIRAKNYVGVILLPSGRQIEILPKIDFFDGANNASSDNGQLSSADAVDGEQSSNDSQSSNGEDSSDSEDSSADMQPSDGEQQSNEKHKHEDAISRTKKIFLKMLSTFDEFSSKSSGAAFLQAGRLPIYEIFIRMYVEETERLVKRGLKSGYVEQEGNFNVFKGRLLVSQHIRYNAAHQERFYVAYDEFQLGRPENRIIKATLQMLEKATRDSGNSKHIKQLLQTMEEIEASAFPDSDFAKVVKDRGTSEYANIMEWSRLFLKGMSFNPFSGNAKGSALLFPMEKLFESYVAKKMQQLESDWEVSTQDDKYCLASRKKDGRVSADMFRLRPDMVLRKKGDKGEVTSLVIMDTKWKNPFKQRKNSESALGISQGDMYQMFAYSKRYFKEEVKSTAKTPPDVYLLYPLSKEIFEDESYDNIDFVIDDGNQVHIKAFFVDVADIGGKKKDDEKDIDQGNDKSIGEGVIEDKNEINGKDVNVKEAEVDAEVGVNTEGGSSEKDLCCKGSLEKLLEIL